MPYADLHVHTTRSDGSLAPDAIPDAAERADLEVVAITDHDVLPPFEEPVVDRGGVSLIGGIELRVEPEDGERVDLLGYGVRRTGDLAAAVERIQANRLERGRAIVERVEDHLGVDLDVAVDDGFGRPHVARAVDAHPDVDLGYEGAFDELIGDGGPCFVPREVPSFERGRRLLAEACELVSLAHPLRYREPAAALELAAELDAVELAYPYGREADRTPVERTIATHDLLATGGSDAHDERLGLAGLDRDAYRRLSLSG
ncbi:PHP domain-containing protein [Halovivax sp.]|uniref:PHP domain-containing protein n=1 Tax=Halovivax sp. TaxID=1935978 RepID=UPI0025C260D0|nr:PHP domain-containing protein [Halovivax sp.]